MQTQSNRFNLNNANEICATENVKKKKKILGQQYWDNSYKDKITIFNPRNAEDVWLSATTLFPQELLL